MRPGLDNLPSLASVFRIWQFLEPFGELKGQQLAKEAANAHAGVIIAPLADRVLFFLIISINGTIKGQFHETGERNRSPGIDLAGNSFS